MQEGLMSVRPDFFPATGALSGSEGELVSVHICVPPRHLERLLEALAKLPFPVNPQIYHTGGIGYVYSDGREKREPAIIVQFPAFSGRLDEVREILIANGLSPDEAHVRGMLEDIHADSCSESAPAGAPYCSIRFYKHLPTAGAS
jgi:hypothetical protein